MTDKMIGNFADALATWKVVWKKKKKSTKEKKSEIFMQK